MKADLIKKFGINADSNKSGTYPVFAGVAAAESHTHDVDDFMHIKSDREHKRKALTMLNTTIGLLLSMLFVIGLFELKLADQEANLSLSTGREGYEDLIEIPRSEQPQEPPPKIQTSVIVEVTNEEIIEEIEVDLDIEMTEDTKIEEVIFSNEGDEMPDETGDEIFLIVEEEPSPSGGLQSFYSFVSKNLRYPGSAARQGIEGRVFVQFVVEKDGSLTDIKVVKGIGGECDEEAARVISISPKWNLGKQRGRPVRVRMIIPINFKLMT